MKRKSLLILSTLVLLTSATLPSIQPTSAEPTTFYLDPASIIGPPPNIGDTFTLTLRVDNVNDMYMWVADIEWDADIFDIVGNPTEGNALKSGGYATTFLWSSITDGKIDDLTCTRLGSVPGANIPPNPNDMATVNFKVQTYTQGTTITITFARWLTSTGTEYTPTTTGTYFELSPAGVGGVIIPIDKLGLLAPYVTSASIIVATTIGTTIYVKRRFKLRKTKNI